MNRPGRPATGQTPVRTVRIGRVWTEAKAIADSRQEFLRDVIEVCLRRYIARHRAKDDGAE